jgi:hypothetical protein
MDVLARCTRAVSDSLEWVTLDVRAGTGELRRAAAMERTVSRGGLAEEGDTMVEPSG